MSQMSSPVRRSVGSGSLEESPEHEPDAAKLGMAITHAEAMQKALWSHNRAAALEHGRAALVEAYIAILNLVTTDSSLPKSLTDELRADAAKGVRHC